MSTTPGLLGITNSNRDFTNINSWGKNQFNSSFPASLVCYIESKNIPCNYLSMCNGEIGIGEISPTELFGINPFSEEIFFAFESQFSPYNRFIIGSLPRVDLVIQNSITGECLRGLEIKLTALPDNSTCELNEENYGTELVIRPDSIVYLAASIAYQNIEKLREILSVNPINIDDWSDPSLVHPKINDILEILKQMCLDDDVVEQPFLLQPIWKTMGKSPRLAEHCLDVFVWSDIAFVKFITKISRSNTNNYSINRQTRTTIWLYKMLLDIVENDKFNHEEIIDQLSFNTKNDKAFASSGRVTNPYMQSPNLMTPRIKKDEIKNIILGGGQNLLSPERRFDAIIFNSPELFD